MNKDRGEPTIEQLAEWADGGAAEAVDGCEGIEPDGYCPHGSPSWLLKLGLHLMRPARSLPALLLVAVAACTSAAHTAAPSTVTASTTTTTTIDYGVQYLAITAPATDALTRLEDTTSPTSADLQSAESASETLPYQLLQASWPTNSAPDIRALASDWGVVVADLRLLVFNPAGGTTLGFDASKLSAAVRTVKNDLRLPT